MRNILLILAIVFLSVDLFPQIPDEIQEQFQNRGEIYFKFEIESSKQIQELTRIISIDNRQNLTVYAYANEIEFKDFLKLNIDFKLLPHPNEGFDPIMASFEQIQTSDNWNYYPTYDAYVALMYQFEADYPSLCDVFSIGQSVEGRELLVAKISDNVDQEESEPEFFYTSTMHGDEATGYPLMLYLIDTLLSNYGSVARITDLVNEIEIYINPLANPDGTYAAGNSTVSGATRYNANNVDLNRNFPDVIDGIHPNTQPETFAFMAFAENRDFVMSSNFHGGTEVVNYPWDHKYDLSADDAWWQYVSHEYADTCQQYSPSNYMNGYNDGITNGAQWYVIDGGRQDYMNYFHQCREMTLEISDTKLIPEYLIDDHWEYNRRSLLNYMEQCLFGIHGTVTDATTGLPIVAEVFILNHDIPTDSSMVFSSMPKGNYHRMLLAGNYDIQFSAPCYQTQVIQNVVVQNKNSTIIDVQLQPDPNSVDFIADQTIITIGESLGFTDLSCNNPISWHWTFEGGTPATSIDQNPTSIYYYEEGVFDVKLVISDGIISDSITKNDYISVNEEYIMSNGSFTTCSGVFFDSGGPDYAYSNYENLTTIFFPINNTGKIKVEFMFFDVEYHSACDYDWLRIYNGPDVASALIGEYCGTNSPGTIISTHETGALTFEFHSDFSVTKSGWEALINCEIETFEVDLTLFLEGPFNGGSMNTDLTSLTYYQPYNTAPWNYTGTESMVTIPGETVDWVLIELHDVSDASSVNSGTLLERRAALLMSDGSVVDMDGTSNLVFEQSISNQLFVIIRHRNHLDILSANPLTESLGTYFYIFSTGEDKAYGGSAGFKDFGGGIWGMVSGDANADGFLDDNDGIESWQLEVGESGYLNSDVNLNGQSNNQDKNDYWLINRGIYSSQAPN